MPADCVIVARKELVDHLRDTRSLLSTSLQALMGPAVVLLVSFSGAMRREASPTLLLSMMSVFALVTAFAGGMNVAMDSTAGERERRSLVPLLMNPVSRRDVVLGKWIATSLFAAGALAINITGVVWYLGDARPPRTGRTRVGALDLGGVRPRPARDARRGAGTAHCRDVSLRQGGADVADDGGVHPDAGGYVPGVLSRPDRGLVVCRAHRRTAAADRSGCAGDNRSHSCTASYSRS